MQQVAALASLDDGRPTIVRIGETAIMLIRDGDAVRAFQATCPHAGAPLAEAAICRGRIICPWHKANFRLRDGALLEPPALDSLVCYPVRIEHGCVLVAPEPAPPALPPTGDDARTMLIVGAGAAGTAAACALREFGFTGRVVLLGDEPGDPYDRTSLSKFVLQGAMPPEEVPPLRDPDFYATHRIERVHGYASGLDIAARRVQLRDGTLIGYDRVLIATGGIPRKSEVPGAERAHVHALRTREDARAILAGFGDRKPHVVIVGSGFIGLEAASALREQECPVIVVAAHEIPFAAQFGERIGVMFRRLHERNGVRFLGGRRIAAIEAGHVVLDDASQVDADLVLLALGIEPATGFAAGLRKTRDGGIVVDASMRADAHVFAAGDIARFPLGPRSDARIEHWRTAQQQGRIAAAGMLGKSARLAQMPFFWTYHYGKRYEYLGHPEGFDTVQIDGDLDAGDFLASLRRDGETVGYIACGRETETASLIAG